MASFSSNLASGTGGVANHSKSCFPLNNLYECSYIEENQMSNVCRPGSSNNLLVIGLNVQTCGAKVDKLKAFLDELLVSNCKLPDVLALQETCIPNGTTPAVIPGYHPILFNSRSISRGGGVGLLVKDNISFHLNQELSFFIDRVFESIAITIILCGRKVTVISIYKPPSSPLLTNNELLDGFLINLHKLLSIAPSNSIISMDSNINLMLKTSCSIKLIDTFEGWGFTNCINLATRFNQTGATLIDQIFLNTNLLGKSGVILTDLSDHLPTYISLDFRKSSDKPNNKTMRRIFSKENYDLFRNSLSQLNWESVTELQDTNLAMNQFFSIWEINFDLCFPKKKVVINRNYIKLNEFFTQGLLVSRRVKNDLYRKLLFERSQTNELTYKRYRNIYNRVVKTAKKLFFKEKIDSNCNPKEAWHYLNVAAGRSSSKNSSINSINMNGEVVYDSVKMADKFTNFFSSITDNIVNEIPPTNTSFESFLPPQNENFFEFSSLNENKVLEIIKNLEPKTSLDINGVSCVLLKKVSDILAKPLTHILNLSLRDGIFPESLKVSRTCPIYKSGSKSDVNNYRPISCLPIISKVFEKAVYSQLSNFLSMNNILHQNQYGFQKGKSTLHPLINILNFIGHAFNNNKFVVAIFLDFKKAFDMVSHEKLLVKLERLGVIGKNLNWFKSYLSNRKIFSMVNGCLSSEFAFLSRSVPQGSILGPLLFLIFINDMPYCNELLSFLFADDTTSLTSGNDIEQVGSFVNLQLQKIGVWLRSNELAINTSKTKIVIFSNKQKIPHFDFVFNNNDFDCPQQTSLISPIERISNSSKVPAFKMLGVYLDENLSFDYHCSQILSKVNRALYSIRSAKNLLSSSSLKKLYFALIHPHFLYCLPVYGFTSSKNMNLLFKKQKQCMRLITNAKYNAHTEPLFHTHGILQLPDLLTQQKILLMHSIVFNQSPSVFPDFQLNINSNTHGYILRNQFNFYVPRSTCSLTAKMPIIDFPRLWNDLDEDLKCLDNKLAFKKILKSSLLDKYGSFNCTKLFCMSCGNL